MQTRTYNSEVRRPLKSLKAFRMNTIRRFMEVFPYIDAGLSSLAKRLRTSIESVILTTRLLKKSQMGNKYLNLLMNLEVAQMSLCSLHLELRC